MLRQQENEMTRADVERPATRDPARPGGWEPPADVQRRWHKDGFQPQTTLMSAAPGTPVRRSDDNGDGITYSICGRRQGSDDGTSHYM